MTAQLGPQREEFPILDRTPVPHEIRIVTLTCDVSAITTSEGFPLRVGLAVL
jgi:hypothetical protein